MNIQIFKNEKDMGNSIAQAIAAIIKQNPGRLICFAAGDTPLGMLRELLVLQDNGFCDLRTMYYAGLDEWVGLGYEDKGSCVQVMKDTFYIPAGIPTDHIGLFDGLSKDLDHECRKMDRWIKLHGGIFLSVLGVGMNGHIGFNEPFTPDNEGCFSVGLDETTKAVSEKYFGKRIPVVTGITIGWRTLIESEHLFVMASGSKKASIIKKAFTEKPSIAVPASLTKHNKNLIVALDKDAASELKS